jgi:hypothetical protein
LADLGSVHLFGWPGFGGIPADLSIHSLDDLFGWLVEAPPVSTHVIAQSMGGVLPCGWQWSIPSVAHLVLVVTSGGVVVRLGGADWRSEHRAPLPDVPAWFLEDRTDLTDRLCEIRALTLLLWIDSDPVSPLSVGQFLASRIPGARVVTVAGVAGGTHALANERPKETAANIRAHLVGGAALR